MISYQTALPRAIPPYVASGRRSVVPTMSFGSPPTRCGSAGRHVHCRPTHTCGCHAHLACRTPVLLSMSPFLSVCRSILIAACTSTQYRRGAIVSYRISFTFLFDTVSMGGHTAPLFAVELAIVLLAGISSARPGHHDPTMAPSRWFSHLAATHPLPHWHAFCGHLPSLASGRCWPHCVACERQAGVQSHS